MARRKRTPSIITQCPHCELATSHLADPDREWRIRITVLPDEHHYLTFDCADCGRWGSKQLTHPQIEWLCEAGVKVDDLSLIDPRLERDTMPACTADTLAHMFWIAHEAKPSIRQAIITDAMHRCLHPQHPAGGEL